MSLRYVQKAKRGKVGYCNICKQSASLSWDHVPPKGGIDLTAVKQIDVFQRLVVELQEHKTTISQNGVKYRTLCKSCNDALGYKYDPTLNSFACGVGNLLKSNIQLPSVIHYRVKPAPLIRSILGHLLAAKKTIDNVCLDEKIRAFIFNEQASLPIDIKIFYWLYTYQDIIVIRDLFMPAARGVYKEVGHFSGILKYFPIAYLVCNLQEYEELDELTLYRDCSLEETVELPICLTRLRTSLWPETPDDGNVIAFGTGINSSAHAVPEKCK